MMKKVLIIEDEDVAARTMQMLLRETAPEFSVIGVLQSIEETVEWFSQNDAPELVFMDIHLADGLAFRIFDFIKISCPIIFTTAYDEYALKAFDVNSIDYLLKPISKEHLERALTKFQHYSSSETSLSLDKELLAKLTASLTEQKNVKKHLLIPHKDHLIPVSVSEIACFYVENKLTNIVLFDNSHYYWDKTLDTISEQLDENDFFRANRQYIIAHKAVTSISYWFGGKLNVSLSVKTPEDIIVSKARVADFKQWYTK